MNDDMNHQPTPEFRSALEREILRELRSERMFGPADEPRRMRFATVAGMAAAAVIMLTIGLVLGAGTGYASAENIVRSRGDSPLPPTAGLLALRIPPLMISCSEPPAPRAAQLPPPKQQGIPVIDLPPAAVKTAMTLGGVLGMRQFSNGSVLVNDAARHQMRLFDSTLTLQSIVRDSIPGSATSYGPRPLPLVPYLGDSSLISDMQSGSLLVMGPSGQVVRAMAPSHPKLMQRFQNDHAAVDPQGRMLFTANIKDFSMGMPGGIETFYSNPDSTVIIRVDADSRRADTLARLKTFPSTMMIKNGGGPTRFTHDPLPLIDEWAITSDGAIAVVRGHDYHIDWIMPDGSTRAAPKMPFDWKRLTDEDKQKLIDSTREATSPEMALALGRRRAAPPPDGGEVRTGRGFTAPGEIIQGPPVAVEYVAPKLSEMFDFSPAIRRGAVSADLDGNVWILPSSSAQSKQGELVYDVVNVKGDFHRVRVPLGRSIAGFGKGGVVYLQSGDKTNGFYLEKTRLPVPK